MQNIQAIVNGTSWSKRLTDQAINLHKMQIMRTKKPIRRNEEPQQIYDSINGIFQGFWVSLYLFLSFSVCLSLYLSITPFLSLFLARSLESLEFTLARAQCVAYYANIHDSVTSPGNQIGVNIYVWNLCIYVYIVYACMCAYYVFTFSSQNCA